MLLSQIVVLVLHITVFLMLEGGSGLFFIVCRVRYDHRHAHSLVDLHLLKDKPDNINVSVLDRNQQRSQMCNNPRPWEKREAISEFWKLVFVGKLVILLLLLDYRIFLRSAVPTNDAAIKFIFRFKG